MTTKNFADVIRAKMAANPELAQAVTEEAFVARGQLLKVDLQNWITEYWGERCPDCEPGCFVCRAWQAFDAMTEFFPGEDE